MCPSRDIVLFQINGVAFDWTTQNVYWADGQYKMIGVIQTFLYYAWWKPVVSNLYSPKDVAVDPLRQ